MTNAISMDRLTKHYRDVQALTDLTLDVPAGTVFGFLGPNGAGKTTALKVLAGLARATSGSATVERRGGVGGRRAPPPARLPRPGPAVLRLDDRVARRSATSPASAASAPIASARSRTSSGASASPTRPTGGRRPTRAACASASASPRRSSAGRRSSCSTSRSSALDPIGRKDVLDLMRELKGETTVFYSTHILDDVQRVSDHVAILDHGRLVKAAPTHVLLGSFTANTLRVVLGGAKAATEVGMRQIPGVASVTVVSRSRRRDRLRRRDQGRRVGVGPAGDHAVRGRRRPDAHRQRGRDARPRDGLPPPHRPEGGGRMTVTRGPSAGRAAGPVRAAIAGHPVAAFIAIAFGSTWAMTGLLSISLLFGLVALFGPALGAVVVSWADGSLGDLRQRFGARRASPRHYLVALGLPFAICAAAAVLWTLDGPRRARHRLGQRDRARDLRPRRRARRPGGEASCCRGCASG